MIEVTPDIRRHIQQRLTYKLREYTNGRKNDVARGAETAELAALLVQKYGEGLAVAADIVAECLDGPRFEVPIFDRFVEEIDPQWKEHMKQRWAARPAALKTG